LVELFGVSRQLVYRALDRAGAGDVELELGVGDDDAPLGRHRRAPGGVELAAEG
jgi:hypothetical protein